MNWEDYKEKVRASGPSGKKIIDEVEATSRIVGAMIERRHVLQLSQRELASLCGIPQSSVARIENGASIPNLGTVLKIFNALGLSFLVCPQELSK